MEEIEEILILLEKNSQSCSPSNRKGCHLGFQQSRVSSELEKWTSF